jgi:CDP-paratose 2-epimerase
MNILIAGGCGFVGTNMALYFHELGNTVCCVDSMARSGVEINATMLESHGIQVVRGPVQGGDFGGMKADVILNCAAQSSATKGMVDPMVDFYANLETVAVLLEEARNAKAMFFQWSTNKVYPAEVINEHNAVEEATRYRVDWLCKDLEISREHGSRSIYGATKVAAEALIEEWALAYDLTCVVNRCSCLAGPYQLGCADQGWVAAWVICHLLGQPLDYIGWSGKQVRDVLSILDLERLIELQIQAGRSLGNFSLYNVGGGPGNTMSLREATALCQEITGEQVPMSVYLEPRWADHRVYVTDIAEVSRVFGWVPERSKPRDVLEQIYDWASVELDSLR